MSGDRAEGGHVSAVSRSSLFIVLAAIASLAIALAAADAGLWLVVAALIIGWARWAVFAGRVHLVLVPRCLAEIALDERWKDPDWDASEALIHLELVTVAHGNTRVLARARRRVQRRDDDLGRRTVALGRVDAAMLTLRGPSERSHAGTRLLTILAPTSWAVGTGSSAVFLLSETTPGPVLAQPWRVLAGLVAAGATSSLVTRARRSSPVRSVAPRELPPAGVLEQAGRPSRSPSGSGGRNPGIPQTGEIDWTENIPPQRPHRCSRASGASSASR